MACGSIFGCAAEAFAPPAPAVLDFVASWAGATPETATSSATHISKRVFISPPPNVGGELRAGKLTNERTSPQTATGAWNDREAMCVASCAESRAALEIAAGVGVGGGCHGRPRGGGLSGPTPRVACGP